MQTLKTKLAGTAAMFALASVFSAGGAAPAFAQVHGLFGGGATFPEKFYRDIFDCYGSQSSGELHAYLAGGSTSCNTATPYNANREILYVGVGSGNALNAYTSHNPHEYTNNSLAGTTRVPDRPPVVGSTDVGSFYGAGVGTGWVAALGPDYPHVTFAGSDDPLTWNQLYNTAFPDFDTANWGQPIQFPTLVGTVVLDYNPAAGGGVVWTENGTSVAGNAHQVSLSTNTWCGIWTGDITDWNDPEITADNHATSITGGVSSPIFIAHRSDGSGTTFVFANALIHQCGTDSNHITSGAKLQKHPVPDIWWPAGTLVANQVSDNSFFVKAKTNTLAQGGTWPANFHGFSGNGGVKGAVNANTGSMGYNTPDFVNLSGGLPDPTGPSATNLQTWASFGKTTKLFAAPTPAAGTLIMKTAKVPKSLAGSCITNPVQPQKGESIDGICSHNALNWGATNPAPTTAGAYPIGGFTFANLYTCYADVADRDGLAAKTAGHLGLWRWYFGSAAEQGGTDLVAAALAANGFAKVPTSWAGAIKKLLTTDKKSAVGIPNQLNTGCATVSGTGA